MCLYMLPPIVNVSQPQSFNSARRLRTLQYLSQVFVTRVHEAVEHRAVLIFPGCANERVKMKSNCRRDGRAKKYLKYFQ